MTECEKCKIWDMAAKEAGKAGGMCGDCFDRNHTIFKSEYTPMSEEFACSICDSYEKIDWSETEEGKKQFLDILNDTFFFHKNGECYRKTDSCAKCKNELVACVCMQIDEEL